MELINTKLKNEAYLNNGCCNGANQGFIASESRNMQAIWGI